MADLAAAGLLARSARDRLGAFAINARFGTPKECQEASEGTEKSRLAYGTVC
jgi:hypothetical protein